MLATLVSRSGSGGASPEDARRGERDRDSEALLSRSGGASPEDARRGERDRDSEDSEEVDLDCLGAIANQ